MNRYQIYLNPQSVAVFDELGEEVNVSRSKIIRLMVEHGAEIVSKLISKKKKTQDNYYYLNKLCGFIKSKNKRKTNIAQTVDEIVYSKENL